MARRTNADDRRTADEYSTRRVPVDPDDLRYSRFSGLTTDVEDETGDRVPGDRIGLAFEYTTTHGNDRTLTAKQPTKSVLTEDLESNGRDAGEYYTFRTTDECYAVSDDLRLYRRDDGTFRKIADDVDVCAVVYPPEVPVDGVRQDGVSCTVEYRSARTGDSKRIRLDDVRVDWNGERITGYHARRDRRVEVLTTYDRTVTTKGSRDVEIGKTSRVEFPTGHTYTVDVEGVADADADDLVETIESAVSSKLSRKVDSDAVTVEHDGRIDDE